MLIPEVMVELMNLLAFFHGMRFFLKSCLTISKACLSMSRPSNLQMLSSEAISLASPEAPSNLLWLGFYFDSLFPQRLQQ